MKKMKYIESATLCFLFFMLEHSQVFPVVNAPHSPRKKDLLEAAKTTGKIAAFSIHIDELILAGDIFIIATPPPLTHTHTHSHV